MIYEFECAKGHVTEASVPMGTKLYLCRECSAEALTRPMQKFIPELYMAHRILSATRTSFVFADTGKRIKHIKKVASRE